MAQSRTTILLFSILLGLSGIITGSGVPSFEHLTVGDGLSHNTVYALLQDRSGMYWIGTRNGLNRYDGYGFRVHTSEDERNPTNGQIVLSLLEDRRGRIWAGHRDAGISIYDKATGRFTPFSLGNGGGEPVDWSTISVRALFQDSRGWVWIGTYGGGVIVLDENDQLKHHLSTYVTSDIKGSISNDFVFDFAEDAAGRIYVATSGKGLNLIDLTDGQLRVLHTPDDNDLTSFDKALHMARDGTLWIATSGSGLYRFQPDKSQWQRYDETTAGLHPIVTDVTEDREGNIWVTTDGGGLVRLAPATGQTTAFTYSPVLSSSLNTNALYCLLLDHGGSLWVGSFNGGLNIHRSRQPPYLSNRRYDRERQRGLRSVLSVAQDNGGKTWLGTDGGGLFCVNGDWSDIRSFTDRKGARPPVQGELISKVITAITPTKGGLWYGTYAEGLGYVDLKSGLARRFRHDENDPSSLAHDNVWSLTLDANGGLWAGLLGGGVDYLPPGASGFRHINSQLGATDALSSVLVIDVLLDRNERYLWIATETSGLNRLDINTGEIVRYRHQKEQPNSLSSDRLRCLYQEADGRLWIGTEDHGLNLLRPGLTAFERFDKTGGYPFRMVNGLEKDDAGDYWITGLKTIFRWNPEDGSLLVLPTEEALGYNLYNPGAVQKLNDGTLIFGGVNGFSALQPNLVPPQSAPPPVLLSDFQLANQSVLPGKHDDRLILSEDLNSADAELRLYHTDRGIAFYFAAPTHPVAAEVRYAFKLEGFDEGWNYTELGERVAYYSSLKGGTYRLHVKAAGGDGVWGVPRTPLSIYVRPPFWQTYWFIAAMVSLGMLFIYLLNSYLLGRQREDYKRQAMAREQEILRLRNKNLKEEVAAKQSKLGASVLQMAHKNEFLNDLKNKIQQMEAKETKAPGQSLRSVIRVINHELKQEDYWEQFQLIFDQGYQDFISRLRARHPNLSNNDSRLCCFIRMQLNNSEIASVLNITLNGVEQAKYRLKKKMDLPKELSLNDYVGQFG